jgi:carbon storage regulator
LSSDIPFVTKSAQFGRLSSPLKSHTATPTPPQHTSNQTGRFLMLVLSRKQGQQIFVGSSVVVTIVRVSGDKVRIGIEAPDEMRVLRGELQPHDDLAVALSGASVE